MHVFGNDGNQELRPEQDGRAYPQHAGGLYPLLHQLRLGGADLGQCWLDAVIELHAGFGGNALAGGATDEAQAHVRLQQGQRAADGLHRPLGKPGRRREAAELDDGNERFQVFQAPHVCLDNRD